MVNQEILNRKGARRVKDIPPEVLELLDKGKIETVNLTEWLGVDHVKLIKNTFPKMGFSESAVRTISKKLIAQKKPSTMNSIKLIGASLYERYKDEKNYYNILRKLSNHASDSIRCYTPYLISLNDNWGIEKKLDWSKSLAVDRHFGVREVVWMALRPEITDNLEVAVAILSQWAESEDEYIRRFATEATRPRGVWCKHIKALKENPGLALPILEKLKSDASKYVRDSVGNWLNDASKSKPDFVIELCKEWQKESPTKETKKIVKRARRTIDKK